MAFKQGQHVKWTSQSAGVVKTKVGTIEQIVSAGTYPDRERFLTLYRGAGVGLHRDHESYVVRIPGKTDKAVGKVYWPRVAQLSAAD